MQLILLRRIKESSATDIKYKKSNFERSDR
jgi:hypothetical protein